MAENSTVLFNGVQYGWPSLRFIVLNSTLETTGVSEVSYSQKRTRAKAWGMQRSARPLARTAGKYEPGQVKMKMQQKFANALRALAASYATDLKSYGNVTFDALLQMEEPEDETTHFVRIEDMCFEEETNTFTEGPDGLMEEVVFDVMYIEKDGLSLADATQETV